MGEEQDIPRKLEYESLAEYDAFRNPSIVEEQPFYYKGMSRSEYEKELAYLNQNLSSFYEGSYVPLWKQSWYQLASTRRYKISHFF